MSTAVPLTSIVGTRDKFVKDSIFEFGIPADTIQLYADLMEDFYCGNDKRFEIFLKAQLESEHIIKTDISHFRNLMLSILVGLDQDDIDRWFTHRREEFEMFSDKKMINDNDYMLSLDFLMKARNTIKHVKNDFEFVLSYVGMKMRRCVACCSAFEADFKGYVECIEYICDDEKYIVLYVKK